MKDKKKIIWVNVLKFLGILAIYIGHFNKQAGGLYKFVFSYHVPLFFFASGFFDDIHDLNFYDYFKKNFKRLMIPYFILEIIFLIVLVIFDGLSFKGSLMKLWYVLLGIKDKLPANSLWFIPCLFSIKMVNYWVLKLSKKIKLPKLFPIIVAIFFYLFLRYFLFYKINLVNGPRLFWSIDGVCWYYIYFILGKYLFNYIKKLFKLIEQKNKKWINYVVFYGVFVASFVFTILCYYNYIDCYKIKILQITASCLVLKALIMILFNCYLAYFLSKIKYVSKLLDNIGGNTLYLCGTEQLIKYIFKWIYYTNVGIELAFTKPIYIVFYVLFLLIIDNYLLIPYLKKLVEYVTMKLEIITSKINLSLKRK